MYLTKIAFIDIISPLNTNVCFQLIPTSLRANYNLYENLDAMDDSDLTASTDTQLENYDGDDPFSNTLTNQHDYGTLDATKY